MKKTFTLIIGIIISIVFLNAQEAPPQALSFKASIKRANGYPVVKKTINLRISILKDNEDGLTIYSEVFSPTTNIFGLVDIEIGRGTPLIGDFSLIDWSADEHFLKVEVDIKQNSQYELMSVTQLLSVPYALHAGNGFISEFSEFDNRPVLDENGNIGIGINPSPGMRLRVNGLVSILPGDMSWGTGLFLNATTASGGGGINYILASLGNDAVEGPGKFLIRNNDWSSTFIMDQDGNVGIGLGQESPNYKLDVAGDIHFTGDLLQHGDPYAGDYNDLENRPDLDIYVELDGDQTIEGIKTFNQDLLVNGIAVGQGSHEKPSNTAMGHNVFNSNTTGSDNTAMGHNVLYSNTGGSDNTANGSHALYLNTNGYYNTANGSHALYRNTTGYYNTAIGYQALSYNRTGYYNTAIGFGADVEFDNLTNSTAIGHGAFVSSSNIFVFGNEDVVGWGFGICPGTAAIKVGTSTSNGNGATLTTSGVWTDASDRSKKFNIIHIIYGLKEVMKLRPVTYKLKGLNTQDIGFIAQEVKEIIPEIVYGEEGEMTLSYSHLTSVLTKAIQEQQKQIEDQQRQIDELKQLVQKLTSQ